MVSHANTEIANIVTEATSHIQDLISQYSELIRCNEGMRNTDIHKMIWPYGSYYREFLSHYVTNNQLIPAPRQEVKRQRAEYFPTKKTKIQARLKVKRSNEIIIAQIHMALENFKKCLLDLIKTSWNLNRGLYNSEISRMLGLYDTTNGNHKCWFTYDIIEQNAKEWKLKLARYSEMTYEERTHVLHKHGNVKYIIPLH